MPTIGELIHADAVREAIGEIRRRRIYMALAIIAVCALVWIAIK